MRQRTVPVDFEGFVVLGQGFRQIALRGHLLSAANGYAHLQVRRILEHPVVRVQREAPWFAERFHREL